VTHKNLNVLQFLHKSNHFNTLNAVFMKIHDKFFKSLIQLKEQEGLAVARIVRDDGSSSTNRSSDRYD